MARYRVVEPCAVVQGGRAWKVGDEVELSDAQAADLGPIVARLDLPKSRRSQREPAEPQPEDEGDGE